MGERTNAASRGAESVGLRSQECGSSDSEPERSDGGFQCGSSVPGRAYSCLRWGDNAYAVGATGGATGTGTDSNSGSLTTTNPNDLLFAANYVTSGTTAAGSGYTRRVITSPDGDI